MEKLTFEKAPFKITVMEVDQLELYLSLGVMVVAAVALVVIGSKRGLTNVLEGIKKEDVKPETLSFADAAQFPINGSMALFTMYILVKYVPTNYISLLLGFYLSVFAVIALNYFLRPYVGKNVIVGLSCIAVGVLYFYTDKHWMLTNVFGISIAVMAIQAMIVGNFPTGAMLLSGLFFYDIFWVFGTDVMVSVATNIDGPIKILFPQSPIRRTTDRLSLLGLGDIVIPGFYIAMLLVFSTIGRDHLKSKKLGAAAGGEKKKRHSAVYFNVAVVAYTLSLINTMVVMIVYKHAQPALLYIVPWLLLTTLATALVKGELAQLFEFDISALYPSAKEEAKQNAKKSIEAASKKDETEQKNDEDTLWWFIKDFFGLAPEEPSTAQKKNVIEGASKKVEDVVVSKKAEPEKGAKKPTAKLSSGVAKKLQ